MYDMYYNATISLRVPPELLEALDTARGQVPRSAYVRKILDDHLLPVDAPEPAKPLAVVGANKGPCQHEWKRNGPIFDICTHCQETRKHP